MNKYKQLTAADRSKIEVLLLKKYAYQILLEHKGFINPLSQEKIHSYLVHLPCDYQKILLVFLPKLKIKQTPYCNRKNDKKINNINY